MWLLLQDGCGMIANAKADRRRLLALVHIARQDVGWTEAQYRAYLMGEHGVDSASGLTDAQLNAMVAHFKTLGFRVKPKAPSADPKGPGRRPARRMAEEPQSKKIRALWLALANDGVVRDRSETALAAYVKRITGVAALQWLGVDEATTVIESLKKWGRRHALEQQAAGA
jgi:phage gp16-like protein